MNSQLVLRDANPYELVVSTPIDEIESLIRRMDYVKVCALAEGLPEIAKKADSVMHHARLRVVEETPKKKKGQRTDLVPTGDQVDKSPIPRSTVNTWRSTYGPVLGQDDPHAALDEVLSETDEPVTRAKLDKALKPPKPKPVPVGTVPLPPGVYDLVVVDPPWNLKNIQPIPGGGLGTIPYPVMSLEDIIRQKPPLAENANLFLWTTQEYLPRAFSVLEAWGAEYRFTLVWRKLSTKNRKMVGPKTTVGPTSAAEFVLWGRVGNAPAASEVTNWTTVFDGVRMGDSMKPVEFYEDLVARWPDSRRLDFYSRRSIPGFDSWGNEAP